MTNFQDAILDHASLVFPELGPPERVAQLSAALPQDFPVYKPSVPSPRKVFEYDQG